MLTIYLMSVIIWIMVLKATESFGNGIMKNRTDVNYENYIKGTTIKAKMNFIVISFIPIIRLIVWGLLIFVAFASKEDLDKLLKND